MTLTGFKDELICLFLILKGTTITEKHFSTAVENAFAEILQSTE